MSSIPSSAALTCGVLRANIYLVDRLFFSMDDVKVKYHGMGETLLGRRSHKISPISRIDARKISRLSSRDWERLTMEARIVTT